MSALKLVLWGFLAVLGSVALAFVVGLVTPTEKVNGLWLVVAAGCIPPALLFADQRGSLPAYAVW
jgi:carbon starvation protein